jgi:hypothetical protein
MFVCLCICLLGTVFSIMQADIIDYDELLTGMKRGASYGGERDPEPAAQ